MVQILADTRLILIDEGSNVNTLSKVLGFLRAPQKLPPCGEVDRVGSRSVPTLMGVSFCGVSSTKSGEAE